MMDVCLFVLEIARTSFTLIVRISSGFVICIRKKDFACSWQAPSVDLWSIKQILRYLTLLRLTIDVRWVRPILITVQNISTQYDMKFKSIQEDVSINITLYLLLVNKKDNIFPMTYELVDVSIFFSSAIKSNSQLIYFRGQTFCLFLLSPNPPFID